MWPDYRERQGPNDPLDITCRISYSGLCKEIDMMYSVEISGFDGGWSFNRFDRAVAKAEQCDWRQDAVAVVDEDGDKHYVVARHAGLTILEGPDGFCACNGPDFAADNEETLEDAKVAIDRYWQGDQFGPLNGFFHGGNS